MVLTAIAQIDYDVLAEGLREALPRLLTVGGMSLQVIREIDRLVVARRTSIHVHIFG